MPWSSSSSPRSFSEVIRPPRSGRTSRSQGLLCNFTGGCSVGWLPMRLIAVAACALMLASCSRSAPQAQVSHTPSAPPTVVTFPSATPDPTSTPDPSHVFVIVLENRSADQVSGSGYIAQLAQQYGVATNYHGVYHPSLPNYLALTSGSTWGIGDDGWHPLPAGGLGAQLTAAGMSWRAYMEGMSGSCTKTAYPYALKHNPFPYYGATCPDQVVPYSQFDHDLSGRIPNFVWITPDMCHDGHDCSMAMADQWLSEVVPK